MEWSGVGVVGFHLVLNILIRLGLPITCLYPL
jgi:hypothetical protein